MYYHTWSKENSTHYYEIDFLVYNGSKLDVFEVKSSGIGKHDSINVFAKKYSDSIENLYLLSQKDIVKEGAIFLKPFYLLPFIL